MNDTADPDFRDALDVVRRRLAESTALTRRVLESDCADQIVAAAEAIATCIRSGGKVLFFGNGGSSMDAGHLSAELLGRFRRRRRPLAAVTLSDQTAAVTAIANDYGFEEVFARQIEGLGRPGDVAVALSTSGNSRNVVRALEQAHRLGLVTVALTGADGGQSAALAKISVRIPADDSALIQEASMHLGHSLCELVEARFAGADEPPWAPARERMSRATVMPAREPAGSQADAGAGGRTR